MEASTMTANDHIATAEQYMKTGDTWGLSSESAARAATQALAHLKLAELKFLRDGTFD